MLYVVPTGLLVGSETNHAVSGITKSCHVPQGQHLESPAVYVVSS